MRDACLVLKIGGCHEVEWPAAVHNPGFSHVALILSRQR